MKEPLLDENFPFYQNHLEDVESETICLRLMGTLNYENILQIDYSQIDQLISDQFERISNDIQNLSFFIRSLNFLLTSNGSNDKSIKSSDDLMKKLGQTVGTNIKFKLKKFVPVELLKTASINHNESNQIYSPLFTNHKGICRSQQFTVPIDCLVFLNKNIDMSDLHDIIVEKLHLHVQAIKHCYLLFYQNENEFKVETFYFLIENIKNSSILTTCVYPSNQSDSLLGNLRKNIHEKLGLPLDRPLLRRMDAFVFDSTNEIKAEEEFSKYLINPHLSAKASSVANGKQSLVKGDYVYFHYMQDNFNDNGWGCAYRSFQTIFSWFKMQSYTQKPVPTHRQIQQALVDMDDKPKSFVGSNKWIGSMEISYCLSHMLNVDSKIIFVTKGSEIVEKARELQYHFETEGSPVMIGGGVLAHTIIGVDFNENTGDVNFLVLDPHYPGSEDIKTITNKGWVGWKDAKFWNENSFYNICCPQRPVGV